MTAQEWVLISVVLWAVDVALAVWLYRLWRRGRRHPSTGPRGNLVTTLRSLVRRRKPSEASTESRQPAAPDLPETRKQEASTATEPVLATAAEFQEAARSEPPLLRFFGFRYAGIFNPKLMKRHNARHTDFTGEYLSEIRLNGIIWIGTLVTAAVVGIAVYGFTLSQVQTSSIPRNPAMEAGLAVVLVIGFGWMLGLGIRALARWNRCMVPALAFERADPDQPRRPTGVALAWHPALAFCDTAANGDVWGGPTRRAGAMGGAVVLVQLPVGKTILDTLKGPSDFYGLEPADPQFTEVTVRSTYSLVTQVVDTAEEHAKVGMNRGLQMLGEHWAWIAAGFFGLLIFLSLSSGTPTA